MVVLEQRGNGKRGGRRYESVHVTREEGVKSVVLRRGDWGVEGVEDAFLEERTCGPTPRTRGGGEKREQERWVGGVGVECVNLRGEDDGHGGRCVVGEWEEG